MVSETELRPCPFCGEPAKYETHYSSNFSRTKYHIVYCTFCLEVKQTALSKEAVFFLWNGGLKKNPKIVANAKEGLFAAIPEGRGIFESLLKDKGSVRENGKRQLDHT